MSALVTALPVLGSCLLAAGAASRVPHLPEPEPADDGVLPGYAALDGLVAPATALGAAAGLASATAPPGHWPLLVGFAGIGATLSLVDLRTTFLPLPLVRWCWALCGAGAAVSLALDAEPPASATLWALGAAACTALFWCFWRLGGLGFGDVRLAPLLGACAASGGWDVWWAALVLTSLLGVATGLVTIWWRRRHPSRFGTAFAYGPAMWTGCWVALALHHLLR